MTGSSSQVLGPVDPDPETLPPGGFWGTAMRWVMIWTNPPDYTSHGGLQARTIMHSSMVRRRG